MNTEQVSLTPVLERSAPQTAVADELTRVKIFLGIQAFFLVVSVFTGGFNFKLWSMLDTALMIQSIGITAWVVVHPRSAEYKRVLKKQIPPISSCMKAALTLVVLVVTLGMGFAQGTVVLENQTNGLVKQWTSFSDQTLISVPESGGYVQLIAAPIGFPLAEPLVGLTPFGANRNFTSLAAFLGANPGWVPATGPNKGYDPVPDCVRSGDVQRWYLTPFLHSPRGRRLNTW